MSTPLFVYLLVCEEEEAAAAAGLLSILQSLSLFVLFLCVSIPQYV